MRTVALCPLVHLRCGLRFRSFRRCGLVTDGPSAGNAQRGRQHQRNYAGYDEDCVGADAQPFEHVERSRHLTSAAGRASTHWHA
jgi:hypothetical protein